MWKLSSGHGTEKGQFSFQSQRKATPKYAQTTVQLHSYASKFGKLSSGHRTGKGQFSFQSQRKAIPKNAQTTAQLHSSHYTLESNAQNSPSQTSAIHEP